MLRTALQNTNCLSIAFVCETGHNRAPMVGQKAQHRTVLAQHQNRIKVAVRSIRTSPLLALQKKRILPTFVEHLGCAKMAISVQKDLSMIRAQQVGKTSAVAYAVKAVQQSPCANLC